VIDRTIAYVRVSSNRQKDENQIPDIMRLCEAKGWKLDPVVDFVRDRQSAKVGAKGRDGWDEVKRLAMEGRISRVVIWALDRTGRGVAQIIHDVDMMWKLGVDTAFVKQPFIDRQGPFSMVIMTIFAAFAELENEIKRERNAANIAFRRNHGLRLGRRSLVERSELKSEEVLWMVQARAAGATWGQIQTRLRDLWGRSVNRTTIAGIVKRELKKGKNHDGT
jgi:putative DNA-invertase from lambdoid prophage Rac